VLQKTQSIIAKASGGSEESEDSDEDKESSDKEDSDDSDERDSDEEESEDEEEENDDNIDEEEAIKRGIIKDYPWKKKHGQEKVETRGRKKK
jgi:hypothetical protein